MPTALAARRSKSGKMSDGTARGAPLRGTSTAKETVPKISWTSRRGKIGMRRNRTALAVLTDRRQDALRRARPYAEEDGREDDGEIAAGPLRDLHISRPDNGRDILEILGTEGLRRPRPFCRSRPLGVRGTAWSMPSV